MGKLTKMLRMLGFDAVFFRGKDDAEMLQLASSEGRMVLTRDTHILERSVVATGKIKAILIKSADIVEQTEQIIALLNLRPLIRPFTRCLEDNHLLVKREKEDLRDRVPPYVWQTQSDYVECPKCKRVYWKGTHWQAMRRVLATIPH